MAELPADSPQSGNESSRRCENSQLLYSDATYNARDFISQEDDELELRKSYGDGSPSEICAFKLNQGKIDELADDHRATCVSSSRESSIQKESRKETVKSDSTLPRNEDKSRCKSNRKRKTRRKMPEGVIVDLSNDVHRTFRDGIKISVISMHSLVSEMKFIAIPKKRMRYSIWSPSSRNKMMKKLMDNSVLTVLCTENGTSKMKRTLRSKRKCKNYSRGSTGNMLHKNVDATVDASERFENILDRERELHVGNNTQSFFTPNETLDSTGCCHRDDMLIDIDNAQRPILNAEQTCVDARKCVANYCCSIFNDEHQEYQICDREDYNADSSAFGAEMQTDWTAERFRPACTRARRCRCFCDSSERDPDITMQCNRCPPISRTAKAFENSVLPRTCQREEVERLWSDELRTDIAPEFATEVDEYSPDGAERCADRDGKGGSSAGTIQRHAASKASVFATEPDGSVTDLHNSRPIDTPRREIDTRPEKCGWRTTTALDQLYKSDHSDLLKGADTWDVRAWRNGHVGRRCADRVVAGPSRTYQHPEEENESARGVDSKWKRDPIETDAQQLNYKWKRKIATVDAGTRARTDFKGKRDSGYKSKEAIRVQLRESAKIRERKSLEMVEATSQTRSDNINDDSKRRETRDYSLWTSLQMDKIWSQMHDACKNVVKLAAASVGNIVKDAPKSERSQKNPVEVTDTMLVKSSSSCADKICGETCRKNLMHSKSGKKTEARQERTIGDVGRYPEDTVALMRKNSRTIAPSRHDLQKHHAYQNVEKEEDKESCVTYNEYERDKYRNIIEFPLRNETHYCDEDVHSHSCLNESFTYLEDYSTYPRLRSRGGSDFARGTIDKQKSTQRSYEEAGRSTKRYQNSTSKKCICYDEETQEETRTYCTDRSSQHVVCCELSIITDHQATRADVASRNNSRRHESRSTSISSSEDNGRIKTSATPEQTRACDERAECESIEDTIDAETERSFTSANADVVSSTEADPMVQSSQNESVASTSEWKTSVSPKTSRRKLLGSKSPFCAIAKFWRKRSSVDNKTITSVLKRSRRKELPSTTATTRDSGMKITQIESVQTVREDNKKRIYVNVQVQTPDVMVTRVLSELLLSGEKKRRVLMSIILQSESDHDRREVETQTSSSDLISARITFGYPGKHSQSALTTATKTVQCFVCDKQDCYETRRSDSSITLEETLIAEYPESSELNSCLAEQKADIKIPP